MDNEVNKPICEWINDLVNQGNSQAERIIKLEEGGGSSEDIEELKKCCKKVQQDIQRLYWRSEHLSADLDDIRGDIMNLQDDLEVLSDSCDGVNCKIEELEKCCKYSKDKICELERRIKELEEGGCGNTGCNILIVKKLPQAGQQVAVDEWHELQKQFKVGDFIYETTDETLWFAVRNEIDIETVELKCVAEKTDRHLWWDNNPV